MISGFELFISLGCVTLVVSRYIPSPIDSSVRYSRLQQSRDYLRRYGYLKSEYTWLPESIPRALTEFQRRAHLNITGRLDNETMEMMNKKRCGVPDISRKPVTSSRVKRYVLSETMWQYRDLSYCIQSYPKSPYISHRIVDQIIAKAFRIWSEVSGLTFTQHWHCNVDIVILFSRRYHGDTTPFDGPGNILAHAYFPGDNRRGLHGDLHFDDDEPWGTRRNNPNREDIFCVAVHELGHSLGLQHSQVKGAIMSPWARTCTDSPLVWDDIRGIQSLYGYPRWKRSTPTAEVTTSSSPPATPTKDVADPDMCNGKMDSVTTGADGRTYGFKGRFVYVFENGIVATGYPRVIHDIFNQAPDTIDSAITVPKVIRPGEVQVFTYLFKDKMAYKYHYNERRDVLEYHEGPVLISEELSLQITRVDTAFYLDDLQTVYFVTGRRYRKMRINNDGVPRIGPAQFLSALRPLRDVPEFRAAVRMPNKQVYFFTGDTFFRLDGEGLDRTVVGPLDTSLWWFHCDE